MAYPIGKGELPHPRGGNTELTTIDLRGNKVVTKLWIDQIYTGLNMQIATSQLRRGVSYKPIRLSERFLTIGTLWNVADRDKYLRLLDRIREHWAANFNEDRPTPMLLKYYGANKSWKGFIEGGEVSHAVTDVILRYQFNMRLAITPGKAIASKLTNAKSPITPNLISAKNVRDYGDAWYDMDAFAQDADVYVRNNISRAERSSQEDNAPGGDNRRGGGDRDRTGSPPARDDGRIPKSPTVEQARAYLQKRAPFVWECLDENPAYLNRLDDDNTRKKTLAKLSSPGVFKMATIHISDLYNTGYGTTPRSYLAFMYRKAFGKAPTWARSPADPRPPGHNYK